MIPSTQDLAKAAFDRLASNVNLTVYQSVADPSPPADAGGTTVGYAVLHPFGGDAGTGSFSREPGQLMWQFQVSCAGGDHDYVFWTVDTVRALLDGQHLVVAGVKVGLMQPPPGYQPRSPSPVQLDSGQRLQVPLLYQVLAVPA